MARRKIVNEGYIDPEVTTKPTIDMNVVEIRGRGNRWRLYLPDAQNMVTQVAVYDREGKAKGSVGTWVATNKMNEAHEIFTSLQEAKIAAEFDKPGCVIKVIKTSNREEALAKARATRKRKEEDESDT